MSTRTTPRITLETEAFADGDLEIARLTGRETSSQLFQYEILAVCRERSTVETAELIGREAALVYARDGREERRILARLSVVNDRLETESEHGSYRLTFVPRAYRLSLVETLDVVLDTSVPDILRQKLEASGFRERDPKDTPPPGGSAALRLGQGGDGHDFELRLYDRYPVRDFTVQYKETDLAFVSRLCEHLGVSFFFEHATGRDVMVFTDRNDGFRPTEGSGSARFRGRGEETDVYAFDETIKMIPSQYVVRDYNYRTPQVTLTGQAQVPTGLGSVVEYGSHVKTPDEADQMASIRAEERMASRLVYEGRSDVAALSAGARLLLHGHPRGDGRLLLTEVRQAAEQATLGGAPAQAERFEADFKAIKETRRYRPPRLTPKPRIHGVVNGVIDSASDDHRYADVDEHGRYRVRFLFDTTGPDKGQASKLVRMAQPHVGEGFGMHFPLRAGVEVIITFVDGDPDRPIIAATVPNPQTASPVASGNAPRNVIRTGGGNEINIDDTQDKQRIKLTTPHLSTTFQLGSPNSPEGGAMLETAGASSTVATSAVAGVTSLKSGFTTLGELKSGGWIETVAERNKWLWALTTPSAVAGLVASGLETASSLLEMASSAWDANIARLHVKAVEAQLTAKDDRDKATASRDAALAALATQAGPYNDAVDQAAMASGSPYALAESALRAQYGYGTSSFDQAGYDAAEAQLLAQPGMAESQTDTDAAAAESVESSQVAAYQQHVDDQMMSGTGPYVDAEKALRQQYGYGTPGFDQAGYAAAEAQLLAQPGMAADQAAAWGAADQAAGASYPALKQVSDGYQASQVSAALQNEDSDEQNLRVDQEWLRDAKLGNATGTSSAATEYNQANVDALQQQLADSQATLYQQQAALVASLGSSPQDAALAQALDQAKADNADADGSWDDALGSKQDYDSAVLDKENGDSAQTLAWVKQGVDYASMGASLFSEVLSLISVIKDLLGQAGEMEKRDEAKAALAAARPMKAPTAFGPRKAKKKVLGVTVPLQFPVRHTIGSEGDTYVYAEEDVFVRGKHAAVYGEESVALASDDALSLMSAKEAELAAGEKVSVTSTEIELTALKPSLAGKAGAKVKKSDVVAQITLEDGDIDARSMKGEIVLTAAKKAQILAGKGKTPKWGLTVDGEANSVKLGGEGWALDIEKEQAALGTDKEYVYVQPKKVALSAKKDTYLFLNDDRATLQAKKILLAGATSVEIQGPTITVGGSSW